VLAGGGGLLRTGKIHASSCRKKSVEWHLINEFAS
jgi:hypothetical protein